jgi:hypothetical protein
MSLSGRLLASSLPGALLLSLVSPGVGARAGVARAAEAAPNTLTAAEKKAGWKLLFDGKSTKGWRGYNKKEAPASWKVIDGVLTFDKVEGQGGDLLTEEQYESFELAIDWKISPKGNSGVMYHVQETEKSPYMTGPEMQVLDNGGHADGKNPLTSAGSGYALYPPSKDVTRPVGEWNSARLLIDNGKAEHWLNGEKIVTYDKGSDEWKAKVAESKFKAWANFGVPTKGHIDLQDHGNKVEFRNIKIRIIRAKRVKAAKPAK